LGENFAGKANLEFELAILDFDGSVISNLFDQDEFHTRKAVPLAGNFSQMESTMIDKSMIHELLTESEAAKYLKISERTLQAWRCNGAGPAFVRIGRAIRYQLNDILAWISANTVKTT
jgi:excisionase family DNA binding protein